MAASTTIAGTQALTFMTSQEYPIGVRHQDVPVAGPCARLLADFHAVHDTSDDAVDSRSSQWTPSAIPRRGSDYWNARKACTSFGLRGRPSRSAGSSKSLRERKRRTGT